MMDQIHDAFAALQAGDPVPMTMAVAQYGPEEVGVVLAEAGIDLGEYWPMESQQPEAEEPQPGGRMTRDGLPTGTKVVVGGHVFDVPPTPAVDVDGWPNKVAYVSDPLSPGYDPLSSFYTPNLDSSMAPLPKKKANAGLWGLALVLGALAFGAM